MDENVLLTYVLSLLGQVKLYHWSTMSYIHHKALDELHDTLSPKIDLLVETFIGRYNKQPLKEMSLKFECNTATDDLFEYLVDERETMKKMLGKFETAPEIQSIIEDMMAAIDKCLYVSRLHDCRCKM